MRHRFRRSQFVSQRTRRHRWLAAGGAGTSVLDDCHHELSLIATRRGGEDASLS